MLTTILISDKISLSEKGGVQNEGSTRSGSIR